MFTNTAPSLPLPRILFPSFCIRKALLILGTIKWVLFLSKKRKNTSKLQNMGSFNSSYRKYIIVVSLLSIMYTNVCLSCLLVFNILTVFKGNILYLCFIVLRQLLRKLFVLHLQLTSFILLESAILLWVFICCEHTSFVYSI